jgi:hypothetical protein
MKTQRVLPADVYDALELSALAFGGIGAGSWGEEDEPCCIVGHAVTVGIPGVEYWTSDALEIGERANDAAVERINSRLGLPSRTRVLWADYCAELNVVRGT